MKFYNRQQELEELNKIYQASNQKAHLVIIKGRRRIGKTTLALKSIEKRQKIYLFVTKKKPKLLLEDFEKELKNFGIPFIGHLNSFDDFFELIFQYSKNKFLIVILDEFQNFKYVDPSVFSILQKYWDKYKDKSKIILVIIGSMTTLMKKIFLSRHEPLFGRSTNSLEIHPLNIKTIAKILKDMKLNPHKNLLYYYAIFGGIPKYYDLIDTENLYNHSLKQILFHLVFKKNAKLQEEGETLLIEELGKNYFTYFSVLEAISRGRTKLTEIANMVGIPVASIGKYLDELENYYQIIERRSPIFSKPTTRISRYYIKDNFLRFWFRYVYKNKGLLEQGQIDGVMNFVFKNLPTFSGLIFEDMIKQLLIQKNRDNDFLFSFDTISSYWGRANFDIDIVAANEKTKEIFFGECKLSSKQINDKLIKGLKSNAEKCKWNIKKRKEYFGIFVADKMQQKKKEKLLKERVHVWEFKKMI
ncbi:ATP-binding protein [Patescibacteria group bacterium]|nr:ATP-binding protein [Patescibacteria group bacterium]